MRPRASEGVRIQRHSGARLLVRIVGWRESAARRGRQEYDIDGRALEPSGVVMQSGSRRLAQVVETANEYKRSIEYGQVRLNPCTYGQKAANLAVGTGRRLSNPSSRHDLWM